MTLSTPRFENGRPLLIAGLHDHFHARPWEAIPALWQKLGVYLGKIPGQVGGAAYGLCFNTSKGLGYLSGVEVSTGADLPNEFRVVNIPAQTYAIFPHYGHVSELHNTCDRIFREWFPASSHEVAQVAHEAPCFFERYGEAFDPQAGTGDVEVWIPIKA